jgi:hypothetical protein
MKKVACHDKTLFVDYQCQRCGFIMHIHQSQLPNNYPKIELRTSCTGCGCELILPTPVFEEVK